ncbi:porin [Paraburkholderia aspalathi]|nr:porin [Paraburkholderia aspalathi]MBK3780253.1 porin [Paraburkholderia aspalathi]
MKKALLVAALSGIFATAAHAQSSVTLYGVIDAGITYTNNSNGHTNFQETSGSVTDTRWGIRGGEDLGRGLKAIFTLENGFNIGNGMMGQNGREFGRQAFVGLSSEQFGTGTLGRQYDSINDYVSPLALTGQEYGGTLAAHPFDNDNLHHTFSVNNSLKYQSADYNGLKFGALYGFSNESGQVANNRALSLGASYDYGSLKFGAAYLKLSNSFGGKTAAAALGSMNANGAVDGDSTMLAAEQQTWGAGVNYAFGPAVVGFVYTQTNLSQGSGIAGGGAGQTLNLYGNDAHFQNFELNGHYALTPMVSLAGAYTFTQANLGSDSQPKWGQLTLQADYALSKRTDVYVQGEYQHVMNGEGLHGESIGAMLNNTSESASSTGNQVAMTMGVRHHF